MKILMDKCIIDLKCSIDKAEVALTGSVEIFIEDDIYLPELIEFFIEDRFDLPTSKKQI